MAVGALDETGQEKHGSATAGVKRQYMGCAGRVANGINAVHLFYVREKTCGFRTKGQLAIDILGDAYADGLAFDFICGDEVYGSCMELREFLERRGQATSCASPRATWSRLPQGP
jgi:SRSO17 transposase